MAARDPEPRVLLPTLPCAAPLEEAVLFGFDDRAFPFQERVQTHLLPPAQSKTQSVLLGPGPEGAHDEVVQFYGTVIRTGETFHLWYKGNYGAPKTHVSYERDHNVPCYATSRDGFHWEKPDLGLVEFNGSRHNNIVDLPVRDFWSSCAVLHDPEDPDASRRYKMAFRAGWSRERGSSFQVAFSRDGLRWTPGKRLPETPSMDLSGVTKWRGLYYVNGQRSANHSPVKARRLCTLVSADFEHWSPCYAVGLDRGPSTTGPSTAADVNQHEEVHLGAGLWNRGNVLVAIYGQWHGHPSSERRLTTIDLGLALSHDAIHFQEPIPGFRLIPAREHPDAPVGFSPALVQGQGMENVGERTLYWYSLWRGTPGNGVRLATWERDRLGMLKPFQPRGGCAISCPIRVLEGTAPVHVNASGLGPHSRLRIGLLDEGFRPIAGCSGSESVVVDTDGYQTPVRWPRGDGILPALGPVRLDVQFEGVRPEDCRLHALYVGGA